MRGRCGSSASVHIDAQALAKLLALFSRLATQWHSSCCRGHMNVSNRQDRSRASR